MCLAVRYLVFRGQFQIHIFVVSECHILSLRVKYLRFRDAADPPVSFVPRLRKALTLAGLVGLSVGARLSAFSYGAASMGSSLQGSSGSHAGWMDGWSFRRDRGHL